MNKAIVEIELLAREYEELAKQKATQPIRLLKEYAGLAKELREVVALAKKSLKPALDPIECVGPN